MEWHTILWVMLRYFCLPNEILSYEYTLCKDKMCVSNRNINTKPAFRPDLVNFKYFFLFINIINQS